MLDICVREIVEATGGMLLAGAEETVICGVSTDSRKIGAGELFIPIVGETFDGHDYIDAALEQAAGCLCARAPESMREGRFYVQVEDTCRALRDLAAHYRARFDIPFVQITGSVGKTTTKEMIAAVLGAKYNVLKTEANYNNEIGAPMMMFRLTPEHEAAVIETGMTGPGEIRYLGVMVRPKIAVISNVGDAHFEFFGSREGIFRAKCEIFENLDKDGFAVLNGDDALLKTVELSQTVTFCGEGENCAARVSDIAGGDIGGVSCTVQTARDVYKLQIPAPGRYMVYPAAQAVAVGELLGLTREEIERGVRAYEPAGERMKVERLAGERVVLNDSYNANPQSMAAALGVLAECGGRRIAVLGPLGELGAMNEEGHRSVGRLVGELGIDTFFAIGEDPVRYMAPEARAAGCRDVRCFDKKEDAYGELTSAFSEGSTVLLKASHYAGRFDLIADYLRSYSF